MSNAHADDFRDVLAPNPNSVAANICPHCQRMRQFCLSAGILEGFKKISKNKHLVDPFALARVLLSHMITMKKNILYTIIGLGLLTLIGCSSNNPNPASYPYGSYYMNNGSCYGTGGSIVASTYCANGAYGASGAYGAYGTYGGMTTMQCLGTYYSNSGYGMQPVQCMGQCRGYMLYNQMGQPVYCQ